MGINNPTTSLKGPSGSAVTGAINLTGSVTQSGSTFNFTGGGGGGNVTVNIGGTSIGSESTINFLSKGDITLSGVDNAGSNVALTIGTNVPHGAAITCTANNSVTAATNTPIIFNLQRYDIANDGFWSVANPTRLTIPAGQAGYYDFWGNALISSGISGGGTTAVLYICVNGNYTNPIAVGNLTNFISISAIGPVGAAQQSIIVSRQGWYCNVGDYFELVVYQRTGATAEAIQSVASFTPEFVINKRA